MDKLYDKKRLDSRLSRQTEINQKIARGKCLIS